MGEPRNKQEIPGMCTYFRGQAYPKAYCTRDKLCLNKMHFPGFHFGELRNYAIEVHVTENGTINAHES